MSEARLRQRTRGWRARGPRALQGASRSKASNTVEKGGRAASATRRLRLGEAHRRRSSARGRSRAGEASAGAARPPPGPRAGPGGGAGGGGRSLGVGDGRVVSEVHGSRVEQGAGAGDRPLGSEPTEPAFGQPRWQRAGSAQPGRAVGGGGGLGRGPLAREAGG